MATPTFEAFSTSVRSALAEVSDPNEETYSLFDRKGPSFDFYDDGGLDSLDMLDLAFYVDHDLGVSVKVDLIIHDDKPMTLRNLYDSIRPNTSA